MIRDRLCAITLLTGLAVLANPCAAQAPDPLVRADTAPVAPATPKAADALDDSSAPTASAKLAPSAWAKLTVARPPYPQAVQRALAGGRRACRETGGRVVYRPGAVRTGDLTGDGRPDYIVDFREAECPSDFTLFEGTGGWDIEILTSRPRGGLVTVFAGRVGSYDLSDGPGVRMMRFDVHGSFCGRAGSEGCVKRRRIDGRPFAFRQR